MDNAERFVLRFIEDRIATVCRDGKVRVDDYKSLLQEKVQTSPGERVEYRVVGEHGPDHDKRFTVEVCLNSNVLGRGTGSSKREAEQEAAHQALTGWFGYENAKQNTRPGEV